MQHSNKMSIMPTSQFDFAPQSGNTCSQSRCKIPLPTDYGYKTCEKCRNISRLCKQKRKWEENEDSHKQKRAPQEVEVIYISSNSESSDENNVSNNVISKIDTYIPSRHLSILQTTTPSSNT